MSDKAQGGNGAFFAIPGASILAIEGRDAIAFAQAQFMSDVAALAPGHWHWSGWLTPKGRVIALFALLRLADDTLLLVLPDANANDIVSRLQRFVFRSKATLRACGDLFAIGALQPPISAAGARFASRDDGFELDFGTAVHPRSLRLGAKAGSDDAAGAQAWRRVDLAHGFPRLPCTEESPWTPQQLSLERLKAYSVKKGCYPGQEIVARTHFLGQAKRGLVRLHGAGLASTGEVLDASSADAAHARPLGQVVCSAVDEALAVMPLDAGDGPFSVEGHRCERLPLLDGLAR